MMPKRPRTDAKEKKKTIFKSNASEFWQIVEMEAFVDHTMIVKEVLENHPYKFVLAPSRFGKSVNMNTVRTFLEIEVDTDGKPVRAIMNKAASVNELRGGRNYELFCVPEGGCKILKEEELVLEHFGRYPVIKLDLAANSIKSLEQAVDHFLKVISLAYRQHKYLKSSPMLDESEKQVCKMYCELLQKQNKEDLNKKIEKVKSALMNLTIFLKSHFSRKIVLLVDEFDAVIRSAKFVVKTQVLLDISTLMMDMLHHLWRDAFSAAHVEYVFITGIESVSGINCSPSMAGIERYQFLDNEDFIGLYGAEENEIEKLVDKLKAKNLLHKNLKEESNIMKDIKDNYNGYYSSGPESKSILSLWSVLHYLQKGIAERHWTTPSAMIYIQGCLQSPRIGSILLKLTGKEPGEETVTIKIPEKNDIRQLRAAIGLEASAEGPKVDLVLSYLKELGYLSNAKNVTPEKGYWILKVANKEMRLELLGALMQCSKIVGFDFTIMQNVADLFWGIIASQGKSEFQKSLVNWYKIVKKLFEGFNQFHKQDINESVVMSVLTIALSKVANWNRYSSDNRIKDDDGNDLISGRTDIWMTLKDPATGKLYLIIIEIKDLDPKKYPSITQQRERLSLSGLTEIFGSKKKKGYFSAVEKLKPDEYVCMSVSFDHPTNKPSICCLKNSKDVSQSVCLSETEWKYYDDAGYDDIKPLKVPINI